MRDLLLVDSDARAARSCCEALRSARVHVRAVTRGQEAIDLLEGPSPHLILSELLLPDMSGLDVLRHLRRKASPIPFIVMTAFGTTKDAVTAMRLGAVDFVEKPVSDDGWRHVVCEADAHCQAPAATAASTSESEHFAAHAAARWARALLPVIEARIDPRTIEGWSRIAYSSPGTLRNWCRTAGISARRSLVFARLLRVAYRANESDAKPQNVLDVVDRRTLFGLLKLAGIERDRQFPRTPDQFLDQQTIVRDPEALFELRRALSARSRERHDLVHSSRQA